MDDSDVSSETEESPTYDSYLGLYRLHQDQIRAHLSGNNGRKLPASYIAPAGYWTSTEKDLFFRALAVHSRLRPDLIADCIKTKTIVDVCTYIDILAGDPRIQDTECSRSQMECAMEVSDAWIDWEEEQAASLVSDEPEWDEIAVAKSREEEISAKKVILLEKLSHADNEEARRHQEEYNKWESQRRYDWSKADALSTLTQHHLKAMESILRNTSDDVTGVTLSLPERNAVPTDDVIDPSLLEMSRSNSISMSAPDTSISIAQPSSDPLSSPTVLPVTLTPLPSGNSALDKDEIIPPNLSPASRRRLQKRLYMRRKRAELTGANVTLDAARLKPGRKAKERKPRPRPTTYIKRGQDGGDKNKIVSMAGAADSTGYVNSRITATPASIKASTSTIEQSVEADAENLDVRSGGEEEGAGEEDQYAHPHIPGMTRSNKIKTKFSNYGIDHDALRQEELDLFHPSAFGRLMALYQSVHGVPKSSSSSSSVSVDILRFMRSLVVEFMTEAIRHAVVAREEENNMKSHTKVWRINGNQVALHNMALAFEMMGMKILTKKEHFSGLLRRTRLDNDGKKGKDPTHFEETDGSEDDEYMSEIEQDTPITATATGPSFPLLLPLNRELYPPIVRLPSLHRPSSSLVVPPSPGDSLLPLDTDEDLMLRELEEEEKLEALDQAAARACEINLWRSIGIDASLS